MRMLRRHLGAALVQAHFGAAIGKEVQLSIDAPVGLCKEGDGREGDGDYRLGFIVSSVGGDVHRQGHRQQLPARFFGSLSRG